MKKGKGILVIFILLLIVILAGGAYAYIKTDLLKTPEQLFKKYLINNIAQIANVNIAPFNEVSERMENELTETNLNIILNGEAIGEEETYKLNIKTSTDFQNKNESTDISINQGENVLIEGTLALTNNKYGIKIPDIYSKYIALENRDFKKLAKTLGADEEELKTIPDSIKEPNPFTEEELEKIKTLTNKYMEKIYEPFGEESYSAEKNVALTINGQNLTANKYTFTVSSVALYNSLTNSTKELLDDPDFLALCKNRIEQEMLDEFKTSFNEAIEDADIDETDDVPIIISVYVSEQKTVKTEIIVKEAFAEFIIDNKENESIITFLTHEPKDDYMPVGRTDTIIFKNMFKNNKGELSIEIRTEYNQADVEELNNERVTEDEYYSDYDYADVYKDEYVRFLINTTKKNENTINSKITFEGDNVENANEFMNIEFGFNFNSNIKVKKLTSENSIIVNDYTLEEFQTLGQEIMTNIMNVALEKPESLIGMIFVNMNSSMMPETVLYPEDVYMDDEYTYTDFDIPTEEQQITDVENPEFSIIESDENLYTPTEPLNPEDMKNEIDTEITTGLGECLGAYKAEYLNNQDADIATYLTVENLQASCPENYTLELLEDGITVKCTIDETNIYYAVMDINGDTLVVTDVIVYTEQEYLNM